MASFLSVIINNLTPNAGFALENGCNCDKGFILSKHLSQKRSANWQLPGNFLLISYCPSHGFRVEPLTKFNLNWRCCQNFLPPQWAILPISASDVLVWPRRSGKVGHDRRECFTAQLCYTAISWENQDHLNLHITLLAIYNSVAHQPWDVIWEILFIGHFLPAMGGGGVASTLTSWIITLRRWLGLPCWLAKNNHWLFIDHMSLLY